MFVAVARLRNVDDTDYDPEEKERADILTVQSAVEMKNIRRRNRRPARPGHHP